MNVSPSTTAKDASHDSLEILVDLDKQTIGASNSNIWDEMNTKLELCARVQLKAADDMIIYEDSRDIAVDFDMEVEFVGTADVSFNQALLTSGSSTATVENYVQACTCDDATSFTCNTNTIGPNSLLNVCIKSVSDDMNIDFIQSLVLKQGSTELKLIDGGNVQNTAITSGENKVTAKNGVHVASLVPTQFFSYGSTSNAQLSGLVYLQLPGSRRLAVAITGQPKVRATASTRALALFGEEQEQASSFVIDLQLEKEILKSLEEKEILNALYKEILNAANMQSGFFAFSCIAPIITAIAVML